MIGSSRYSAIGVVLPIVEGLFSTMQFPQRGTEVNILHLQGCVERRSQGLVPTLGSVTPEKKERRSCCFKLMKSESLVAAEGGTMKPPGDIGVR